MRILISIIMTISDYKIKVKTDKAFIRAFSRTHKIFDNESHVTFNHFSDETQIDQNLVFSTANMIIAEKIISVTNAVSQIIQLETVNSHSTLIKCL